MGGPGGSVRGRGAAGGGAAAAAAGGGLHGAAGAGRADLGAGLRGALRAQPPGGAGGGYGVRVGPRGPGPVRDRRDRDPERPGGDQRGDPDGGGRLRAGAPVLGGGGD